MELSAVSVKIVSSPTGDVHVRTQKLEGVSSRILFLAGIAKLNSEKGRAHFS